MVQCAAKSKRSQQQCRRAAMHGRTTCYMHGGPTPRGFGLPQTKTGKYSSVLPLRLAARYEEALANKDLLSVRDDVAVAEARLTQLLQRVETGESDQRWQTLRRTLEHLDAAVAGKEQGKIVQHLGRLRQLIGAGSDEARAWQEIAALWESRCKMIATEQRTLIAQQQMVTVEQLMLYFGVITDAIQRIVSAHADPTTSRAILAALSTEFARISVLENGAEA